MGWTEKDNAEAKGTAQAANGINQKGRDADCADVIARKVNPSSEDSHAVF